MAKAKEQPVELPVELSVELPADSACAVYKDKAGNPFNNVMPEGRSNFGAITAEAIKSVEDAKKAENIEVSA